MAVSRFEAQQGDTVRLRVRIERGQTLFDPYAFDDVQIRRRTSATTDVLVDTIAAASITREAVGIYFVDWPIPTDEPVGAHVDRWTFTELSGGTAEAFDADFAVFASGSLTGISGYLTIADVRAYYLPGSPLTDAELALLIEQASDLINRYCGRSFGSRAATVTADGTGQAWLVLDDTVQSISEITVRSGGTVRTLDPSVFVLKGRWIVHRDFLPWPNGDDSWQGCASVCGCVFGDIFERGQRNVTIVGTFGDYATVPPLIKRACGLLCKYGGQDGTVSGPMAWNFNSESVQGHSYGLRDLAKGVAIALNASTGIPEVDHILNLFRRVHGRMSVI